MSKRTKREAINTYHPPKTSGDLRLWLVAIHNKYLGREFCQENRIVMVKLETDMEEMIGSWLNLRGDQNEHPR